MTVVGANTLGLVDTGATCSFVTKKLVDKLKFSVEPHVTYVSTLTSDRVVVSRGRSSFEVVSWYNQGTYKLSKVKLISI